MYRIRAASAAFDAWLHFIAHVKVVAFFNYYTQCALGMPIFNLFSKTLRLSALM
jgi:hypothetical protein